MTYFGSQPKKLEVRLMHMQTHGVYCLLGADKEGFDEDLGGDDEEGDDFDDATGDDDEW